MSPATQTSRWNGYPLVGRLLAVVIFVAPIATSMVVTAVAAGLVERPGSIVGTGLWFAGLFALSVVVLAGTERAARRFAPLAVLLQLSLIFPDQAPNRLGLALRTSSTGELERTVARVRRIGLGDSETEAAENLLVLVAALSNHDRLTRGHSERVRGYTELIAKELDLSDEDRSKLRWAGLLHDIGKLNVPVEILNKPGRLTDDEFAIIKKHPEWGAEIVEPLADWLGPWATAVSQHHEKWDGSGYPAGLAGSDISLGARIVAVADVFDVITSVRSYKDSLTATDARQEIIRCAGSHFDPEVVRAFMAVGMGPIRRRLGPSSAVSQIPVIGRLVFGAPGVAPAVTGPLAPFATLAGVPSFGALVAATMVSATVLVSPGIGGAEGATEVAATEPDEGSDTAGDRLDANRSVGSEPTTTTPADPSSSPTQPPTTGAPTGESPTSQPATTQPPTTQPATTQPPTTVGPPITVPPTILPPLPSTLPDLLGEGGAVDELLQGVAGEDGLVDDLLGDEGVVDGVVQGVAGDEGLVDGLLGDEGVLPGLFG